MQTIKTAAIVVLLMSVIYGAYVSLTTPPESLPPGVEDMIVMDDSGELSIDSALPPSLGDLGINNGVAVSSDSGFDAGTFGGESMQANPNESLGSGGYTIAGSTAVNLGMSDQGSAGPGSVGALNTDSIASSPVAQIASADPAFSATFSDRGTAADSANNTSPAAPQIAIDPVTGYASTGRTFRMPDPANLDPNFIGGQAQPLNRSQNASDQLSDESVSQVSAIQSSAGSMGLTNAIRTADLQYQKDQRKEALSTLSIFYSTPNLSGEQRSELLSRLDPLAANVIYSGKHMLERPHRVGADETLVKIAQRYDVPWQLLANINQVRDPVSVLPGTELKVVRGPFRAEVDLAQKELTLFLGDLYAGRFPIGVGSDPAPKPGTYTVQDKQTSKVFYDVTGSALAPGSPQNPYGNAWIDLGGNMCIHGSPSTSSPSNKGCVSLAGDYADDLYGILSAGSTVTIK